MFLESPQDHRRIYPVINFKPQEISQERQIKGSAREPAQTKVIKIKIKNSFHLSYSDLFPNHHPTFWNLLHYNWNAQNKTHEIPKFSKSLH